MGVVLMGLQMLVVRMWRPGKLEGRVGIRLELLTEDGLH
jgi:Na+-transporting methylmalonyl-CoA/oxaloacetate decarboxylase gamma subunit